MPCFSRLQVWLVCLRHFLRASGKEIVNIPSYGAPPTKHFSGFVEVDKLSTTSLFYYLVESQTVPAVDPLVWYLNGGPGASSLVGLLSENGPLILNETHGLVANPFAWNHRANILYVEFGPGVGFSFCDNSSRLDLDLNCLQTRTDCSPCSSSDTLVAKQNVVFIESLLTHVFPSFAGRSLFLTGESYAGVFIPTLAAALLAHFEDTSVVNLRGIWVTDPCTDNRAQFGWMDLNVAFAYQKGLISKDTFDVLSDSKYGCFKRQNALGDRVRNTDTLQCVRSWRVFDFATAGIGGSAHPREIPHLPMYLDPLDCYGAAGSVDVASYLSRADVRREFHADASPNRIYHVALGNNGYGNYRIEHRACNLASEGGGASILDVYRGILETKRKGKAAAVNFNSILISGGDEDPMVALPGVEAAVKALGFPESRRGARRPWFFNASATDLGILAAMPVQWGQSLHAKDTGMQVGGFVTDFATGIYGVALMFASIRNSGHMVPTYAPQQAQHILEKVLLDGELLAPKFPENWDTLSDAEFYGWSDAEGGTFSDWAREALHVPSSPRLSDDHKFRSEAVLFA